MITVPPGFTMERIAVVQSARELAIAPNGDLYVGTLGSDVYVVAHADSEHPSAPRVFAHIDDSPVAGVALSPSNLFIGAQFGVYRMPLKGGTPEKLVSVRTSGESRDHVTTTVAWNGKLFASVGSSCNACKPDLDETRATVNLVEGGKLTPIAKNIRNAIALAIDPFDGALWAGVAGQDELPLRHPYEMFDNVTAHAPPANYGWPACYDNHQHSKDWPAKCDDVVISKAVFPAYETPIGAAFYPSNQHGSHAFPSKYLGGAFVALHGSWHGPAQGLPGFIPPLVVFVPMRNGEPARAVNWNDPTTQWETFVSGFQDGGTIRRNARPTGVAVGPDGSLFFSDDLAGGIYRIRPKS